jgi:hypothetical protein
MVTARELEGPVYCWETPGKGWLFGLRPDLADPQPRLSIEDAAVAKQTNNTLEEIKVGDSTYLTTNLPGTSVKMSARATVWLRDQYTKDNPVVIITEDVVRDWAKKGFLILRDGVYYLPGE